VGPPLQATEFRLESVSEMGYDATDEREPRGEICIRGPMVFAGYYKARLPSPFRVRGRP
jgi:long-chain acyl-CoA synthetase